MAGQGLQDADFRLVCFKRKNK